MKRIKKYLYPLILAVLSFVSILTIVIFCIFEMQENSFFEGFSIILTVAAFLLAIISLTYGLIVIIKDVKNKNFVLRRNTANIIAVLMASIILIIYLSSFVILRGPASRIVCGTHLSSLGKSIAVYANEHEGYLPDCNQWCDLLIMYEDVPPRIYICEMSDAVIGESSYAMNINLKGKTLYQVDPNTVVLFETIYGKGPNRRDVTVSSRYSYKVLKEKGEDVSFFGKKPEKRKVYKNRWNQAGGPEILTAENHKGLGSHILFADGSVIFIEKEDFNNLYWGQEKNIEPDSAKATPGG